MQIAFLETSAEGLDDEERMLVASTLEEAHVDVARALPDFPSPFVVTVRVDRRVNAQTGEMGRLVTRNWLDWAIDPWRPDQPARGVIAARLRASFVHEAHHATRAALLVDAKPNARQPENPVERALLVPTRSRRLVQIAVEEGLAVAFERDLCPDAMTLGARDLTGVPIDAWTRELIAAGDGDYFEWFFEHRDGRRGVGYQVALHLVGEAIRRSGRSAAALVGSPVDDVIELALAR